MMLPDVRNDDHYNEDFLNGMDKRDLLGFDWATEAVDNLFNNEEMLTDDSDYLEKVLHEPLPESLKDEYDMTFCMPDRENEHRKVETYGDYIRMKILEWLEMERNELVTSMIDNMDDDEYNALRNKVLKDNEKKENPKEYYDSRKYMVTGKKSGDGPDEEESE